MTSAIVNLTDENNFLLNLFKARFGLRNKSDAVNRVVAEYAKEALEPPLRPEYVRKIKRLLKQKGKTYASLDEMMASYK